MKTLRICTCMRLACCVMARTTVTKIPRCMTKVFRIVSRSAIRHAITVARVYTMARKHSVTVILDSQDLHVKLSTRTNVCISLVTGWRTVRIPSALMNALAFPDFTAMVISVQISTSARRASTTARKIRNVSTCLELTSATVLKDSRRRVFHWRNAPI